MYLAQIKFIRRAWIRDRHVLYWVSPMRVGLRVSDNLRWCKQVVNFFGDLGKIDRHMTAYKFYAAQLLLEAIRANTYTTFISQDTTFTHAHTMPLMLMP